ncbi:YicC/YloC family endoribonuclease [Coprobacter tertius]|uniref:YicC family protein n=1 Tax=Coprobacter tertius TaxID=2944915 RepID=A0ABT1MH13_9BACT|nr:YicC/YloC family endoribonuclease [Coprobacter tertius]MCP9611928.1 YicC family protein [Coprobacter tertius]
MIQSMTGFGKAVAELPNRKITVEIKSLNSKQLDLSTRIPSIYREKEMEIRSEIARRLERGKIDFNIYVESIGKESNSQINKPVVEGYYRQIKDVSENLGIALPSDWFQVLLRMPDAVKTEIVELDKEETDTLLQTVKKAIDQLQEFRIQEGEMLQKLFYEKIGNIAALLKETTPFEKERIEKIKARIHDALSKIENFDYDKNRFEQEMIFYIEKLDINEEKHRLDNHLKYFIETMENGKGQGKKLGFISQEIGREINTLGSKSNHVELQKIVVRMKDELEQIKEQVLNVM